MGKAVTKSILLRLKSDILELINSAQIKLGEFNRSNLIREAIRTFCNDVIKRDKK